MASLGTILAGSGIGAGLGQLPMQLAQGQMAQQRIDQGNAGMAQQQKTWDYQNNEMDRIRQQQGIEDQTVGGATDADRLNNLADIAGAAGRGDLQRKYTSAAIQAKQDIQLRSIANASRAITLGQFGPATQMLNQTGLFGNIHSIDVAKDVEQDPHNPTYVVNSITGQNPDGTPQVSPVHVNQQMLYALQAKPGDALHWMAYAQNAGQRNEIAQEKVDNQQAHWDDQNNHWQAQDAAAIRKARAAGGAGGGGRLTDQRWRYQWATTPAAQGGGGMTPQQAMAWAQDPNKDRKDYWQSVKLGGDVAKSGGMFTADDVVKLAGAFNAGKPVTPFAPTQAPAPSTAGFNAGNDGGAGAPAPAQAAPLPTAVPPRVTQTPAWALSPIAAHGPAASPAPAPADIPHYKEGATATNPKTKEKMVFKGGRWTNV